MKAVARAHNLARWAVRRTLQQWLLEHPTVGPLLRALPTYWRFPLEILGHRALVYNPYLNQFAEVTWDVDPEPRGVAIRDIRIVAFDDPALVDYPKRCHTCGTTLCGCPMYLGRSNHDGNQKMSWGVEVNDPLGDHPVLFHDGGESATDPQED